MEVNMNEHMNAFQVVVNFVGGIVIILFLLILLIVFWNILLSKFNKFWNLSKYAYDISLWLFVRKGKIKGRQRRNFFKHFVPLGQWSAYDNWREDRDEIKMNFNTFLRGLDDVADEIADEINSRREKPNIGKKGCLARINKLRSKVQDFEIRY
jgi:hypothetical protein